MSGKVFVAEYVLPGHPDKLCDAIADALVEEADCASGGRCAASRSLCTAPASS